MTSCRNFATLALGGLRLTMQFMQPAPCVVTLLLLLYFIEHPGVVRHLDAMKWDIFQNVSLDFIHVVRNYSLGMSNE